MNTTHLYIPLQLTDLETLIYHSTFICYKNCSIHIYHNKIIRSGRLVLLYPSDRTGSRALVLNYWRFDSSGYLEILCYVKRGSLKQNLFKYHSIPSHFFHFESLKHDFSDFSITQCILFKFYPSEPI